MALFTSVQTLLLLFPLATNTTDDVSQLCASEQALVGQYKRPSRRTVAAYDRLLECLMREQTLADQRAVSIQKFAPPSPAASRSFDAADNAVVSLEKRIVETEIGKKDAKLYVDLSGWGFGMAAVHGSGRVTAAEIGSDRIVRATETADRELRPTAVYAPFFHAGKDSKRNFGVGPLVVASADLNAPFEDNLLESASLGIGLMLNFRVSEVTGSTLGIGVAYALDGKKELLREDFEVGMPAPPGYTEPVFVERSTNVWMFVVTFSKGNANKP